MTERTLGAWALLLTLIGCTGTSPGTAGSTSGGSTSGSGSSTGSTGSTGSSGSSGNAGPSITVTSPAPGDSMALGTDANLSVAVSYAVSGFALQPPGQCSGAYACGHVHLKVDGDDCNTPGTPYNIASGTSSAKARMVRCLTNTGPHTFTVELHHDDHSPVLEGSPVASVSASTTAAGADPKLVFVAPLEGAAVTLQADQTFNTRVTVSNFAIKAPGTCGSDPACGHLHFKIDGDACNDPGSAFNVESATNPTGLKFALCGTATGAHTVTAELHHDDHSPVTGAGATASVNVTAQ